MGNRTFVCVFRTWLAFFAWFDRITAFHPPDLSVVGAGAGVNGVKGDIGGNLIMSVDVVVVDDEKPIADLVELYLQNEGYTIHKFYTGKEALDYIESGHTDIAVLDLMLPDIDGFTICKTIREKYYFPIIMLTAKVEDVDKIMGLTIGADDYITKPFNPLELVARVKTQLRRTTQYNQNFAGSSGKPQETDEIEIRGLVLNKSSHKCWLYDNPVTLTPLVFSILWYLCEHQGKVVSSEQLFEDVWGEKFLDNNNTVMAHIGRLREKLNDSYRNPKFIKTVWGVGYQIE